MEDNDLIKESLSRKDTPFYPFDWIESKITLLKKTMELVNKNPDEIIPSKNFEDAKKIGLKAGSFLTFYIIQEISDFYRQAYLNFGKKIDFPKSAKDMRAFRGNTVAHINHSHLSGIAEECIYMEVCYGYESLLEEYERFKDILYGKIKSGELRIKK